MCVREDRYIIIIVTCAWFEVFPVYTKLIIIIMSGRKFFNNTCASKVVELRRRLKLFKKAF
jgi:hypothetical protein